MVRALFIGRFQPLHRGHHHAIQEAAAQFDLVVGIGSSNESRTFDNPLTYEERKSVLRACFPGIQIEPIPDQHDGDQWMDVIEEHIEFDICISGNGYVRYLFEQRGYRVEHPAYFHVEEYSGSAIRRRVVNGAAWKERVPDCAIDPLQDAGFPEHVRTE